MNRIYTILAVAATTLLAFTATAFAATAAVGEDGSLTDLLKPVLEAFRGGDYAAGGAFALVLLVALVKRYGSKVSTKLAQFANSDPGGVILVLLASFGATAGAMLTGPTGVSLALLGTAGKLAFFAAGGYALAKKFAVGPLRWLRAKVAAAGRPVSYLAFVLDLVLWIFDKADAVKVAEAAGDQAVKDNPPPGTPGVTGEPTKF